MRYVLCSMRSLPHSKFPIIVLSVFRTSNSLITIFFLFLHLPSEAFFSHFRIPTSKFFLFFYALCPMPHVFLPAPVTRYSLPRNDISISQIINKFFLIHLFAPAVVILLTEKDCHANSMTILSCGTDNQRQQSQKRYRLHN